MWCAEVTIFKTNDGTKHYIHILMDHFSKMNLGYSIEKSSYGKAIRSLIKNALVFAPEKQPKSLSIICVHRKPVTKPMYVG
ncbi:hypothetical protein [Hwangdonia lutea]|uniref:Uncharacterized protein n=1 Tax=Hwangdonia lutea TaxID=3075823 RepID=A0AA97HSY0_9FLAO|nr:hypothetical protein [Hwangdonia sp. SCSIO 19198]WOD45358.1 hypothetical protein RNZ46_16115 [Hwangdonia sp. SCSIO 19198]